MRQFWKRSGEFSDLERELRADRPMPTSKFIRSVAQRVYAGERTWIRPRLALLAAASAVLLVAVASVGGVSAGSNALGSALNATLLSGNAGTNNGCDEKKGTRTDCVGKNGSNNGCDEKKGKRSDCDEYKEEKKKCNKSEDERHNLAVSNEDKRHTNAQNSIKKLPKNQQDSANKKEDATYAADKKDEDKKHDDNDKKCEKH